MNTWLLAILLILLTGYILDLLVALLNLRALSPNLPTGFEDVYDAGEYERSQDYTRARTKFGLIRMTVSTVVTLIFLLSGGFNLIDTFARSCGYGEIITGLFFIFSLLLLSYLLSLPFSVYSTFVIEERFGFNRTTVKTFLLDNIKGGLLAAVLGTPLLSLILWFFISTGSLAWLYCWFGVVVFSVIVQFLAPVLIMPLFNKFSPLEEGETKDAILSYADQQNFKLQGIYTMDGSKRSAKLNAFFTGFGRFRKIVFFDTLLEKLSTEEIVAVLAHEMGHYKLKHIFKMLVGSVLQTGLMFYLLSLVMNNRGLFDAFSMEQVSVYASLLFFSFLYSPVNLLVSIVFNIFSRKHEYEADRFAVVTTGGYEMLTSGLKKLCHENLANLTPHPFTVFIEYTHPPVAQRVEAMEKVAKQL